VKPLKVVIAGPVSAGKSTLIRTLSDTPVVDTDERATDDVARKKKLTTVAMDFGELHLDSAVIYLFGTPGQDRFDFMWEVLADGCLGFIVVVPGDDPAMLPQSRRIFDVIASRSSVPYLIAVSKQDLGRVWLPHEVAAFMRVDPRLARPVICNDRQSGLAVVTDLLALVLGHPLESASAPPHDATAAGVARLMRTAAAIGG
jgi:uncharacterized protein